VDDPKGNEPAPLVTETATGPQCPRCGSRDVHRSRTRLWERPLRTLSPLQPFRCYACRWRGWRRPRYTSEPTLIEHEG